MRQKILVCLRSLALVIFTSTLVFASQGTISRPSNLRSTPSTTKKPVAKLAISDQVEILDATPQNGYYHVETENGVEGWVWGKALRLKEEEDKVLTFEGASQPAATISKTWEKPIPNKTTFKGVDGNCPWNGNDNDPDTFIRKNRTDIPSDYHDVQWAAIHDLPFPKDKPLRKNWSPENLNAIQQFEGVPVRTIGYIVALKPQSGNEEGTNCKFSKVSETDIHIAFVGQQGDGERDSVVVETTPRFLKSHLRWTKAVLTPYLNQDIPVRISGWLMLDPDHRAHLNKYRHTLWEIHPITAIEVLDGTHWKPVDEQ
jgi:hypothetical protein